MSEKMNLDENPKMSRRDEAESLLPFYLNGTLTGEDLALVEDWLTRDPAAQEALLSAETEMALFTQDNDILRPPADAFKRFSDSLEKEATPRVSSVSWLTSFFAKTFAIPAPLMFAAAAAVLAFIVVNASNVTRFGVDDIQIAGTGGDANMPFVLITFAPFAKLADIAQLLEDNAGQFGDGPKPGRTFKIMLSAETIAQYDQLTKQLAASPLVVKLVPGKKPDAAQ